jgi:hypothetical protein
MEWTREEGMFRSRSVLILFVLTLVAAPKAFAQSQGSNCPFQRDAFYEQVLRIQASPDEKITPARVLRWLNSLMGRTILSAPSATEFQPVVNVNDGRVRVIAQLSYKF